MLMMFISSECHLWETKCIHCVRNLIFSHTISLKSNKLDYDLSYKKNEKTQGNLGEVQTGKSTISFVFLFPSVLNKSHFQRLLFVASLWYQWEKSTKQLLVTMVLGFFSPSLFNLFYTCCEISKTEIAYICMVLWFP